jgi:dihydropteroate synthase
VTLDYSRPLIMGILNATPDSFSDGGQFLDVERAVAHGLAMAEEGADIIDVGGESTRPGSQRILAEEQIRRVVGVIRGLRAQLPAGAAISIDTSLGAVARAALDAGADIINDVSAGRDDPAMFRLAAEWGVPIVLMHMQGDPATMQDNPQYQDAPAEVASFLAERAQVAMAAGVEKSSIILDPGIGFGKLKEHNLALLANLDRLVALGYPVLLGASRKRFMGSICKVESPEALMPATCATTALGVMAGIAIFRVHDVCANRQAADVALAIRNASR